MSFFVQKTKVHPKEIKVK